MVSTAQRVGLSLAREECLLFSNFCFGFCFASARNFIKLFFVFYTKNLLTKLLQKKTFYFSKTLLSSTNSASIFLISSSRMLRFCWERGVRKGEHLFLVEYPRSQG